MSFRTLRQYSMRQNSVAVSFWCLVVKVWLSLSCLQIVTLPKKIVVLCYGLKPHLYAFYEEAVPLLVIMHFAAEKSVLSIPLFLIEA